MMFSMISIKVLQVMEGTELRKDSYSLVFIYIGEYILERFDAAKK